MIVRHPSVVDLRNAENRSKWILSYYGGRHYPDLRDVDQYRRGEWIALQMCWRRRALNVRGRIPAVGRARHERAV